MSPPSVCETLNPLSVKQLFLIVCHFIHHFVLRDPHKLFIDLAMLLNTFIQVDPDTVKCLVRDNPL